MLTALLANAIVHGQKASEPLPATFFSAAGNDRNYWLGVLDRLARPVLTSAANSELKKRMPFERTEANKNGNREHYMHLEAVGRLLMGIAPWLELEGDRPEAVESQLRAHYRQLAVASIDAITDPHSPDYCNLANGKQPLVDAAFLAQALLRAPRQLWEPLPAPTKSNVIAALKSTRRIQPAVGNWLLFSATIEATIARFGGQNQWLRDPVDFALREHERYYKGDGSYGDGPEYRWDYYNSFVIQPMLLDVLDALREHGPWVDADFPSRVNVRAKRFAVVQERLISPEGAIPPMGRSLTYRMGALQVLAAMSLRHELPAGLEPAPTRCALTAAMRRMMDAPGTFDGDGWLRVGFAGAQPSLGEGYISTGSLYLCSAGLLPLGLPATDPFWSAPAADWTAKKVYAGVDVPADHARIEHEHPKIFFSDLDFQSPFFGIGLARGTPRFDFFAVDSLGRGEVARNVALIGHDIEPAVVFSKGKNGEFAYRFAAAAAAPPAWQILCAEKKLRLQSHYAPGQSAVGFRLVLSQKENHATLLGLMKPGAQSVALPCVLHLPDMGSFRIRCDAPGVELAYDARRFVRTAFVEVTFPAATAERPTVTYDLEVAAIHPSLSGIEGDPLFDGFRRGFLNIFQVNPRLQMLANNASSDACSFTLYLYSEIARQAPPLTDNLTCNDLVRMTLDRYLAGVKGYGQAGYATTPNSADLVPWKTPWTSLDTYPSFLIAACNYVGATKDLEWGRANYSRLAAWGREMLAADKDGNGLIEYPATGNSGDNPTEEDRRPANWWDTIGFGHEDAYANALAFRAATLFADFARELGKNDDSAFFAQRAAKLRAAYVPTFLNPATGVLAGWKSADGQLHDYWFTFVNGVAITYGLVDDRDANAIMDKLLRKMAEVNYTTFHFGLPGNLVPVRKADYIKTTRDNGREIGEPTSDDGADGFQYYENGGATACFAYFTVKALYKLGRVDDARKIFYPMLQSYSSGGFQGFDAAGRSVDWRDWRGGGHGYEGFLVDSYLGLLAGFDECAARQR